MPGFGCRITDNSDFNLLTTSLRAPGVFAIRLSGDGEMLALG
jgi:hypothetical protein